MSNDDWTRLIDQAGAVRDPLGVMHFGDPAAEVRTAADADVLAELSHLALVPVSGADAQSFLQGQLTNDIREVSATRSQLSAYCTAKGRMQAILRIFQHQGAYHLELPRALADATVKRLRMFVLRSKVVFEYPAPALGHIGLAGPGVERLMADAGLPTPAADGEVAGHGKLSVLHLPGPAPRYEIIADPSTLLGLWPRLAASARPVGRGAWSWLDIQAGLPTVLPETVEEFVPQMANLELVGGVSFKKGCYPGQEIVARMHYLGKLKQRMVGAHVETAAPAPGMPLYAPEFPGQAAGHVVDAQPAPGGGHDLLAVVQLQTLTHDRLTLGSPDGPRIVLRDLPYPLPAAAGGN